MRLPGGAPSGEEMLSSGYFQPWLPSGKWWFNGGLMGSNGHITLW